MANRQARLHWDSVTLIPSVPRPTGGPRPVFATTAVELYGGGRRPFKASGCLGYSRTPAAESMLPGLLGVVVGVSP